MAPILEVLVIIMGEALDTLDKLVNAIPRLGATIGEGVSGGNKFGRYAGAGFGYLLEVGVVSAVPLIGGLAAAVVAVGSPVLAIYRANREGRW